jgi:8-oxo-dGTP pyrophosphatase MutT (NUDIX family)
MIQDTWVDHGLQATATWIPADEYDGEEPLVQAYALCVVEDLVCVIRSPETGTKLLPGGTIEKGEGPVETLHREVGEEANLELSDVDLLGVQRVEYSDTHPDYGEDVIYQARYVAEVDRADFLTEDPSEGFVFERCFVPLEDFADVIGWGDVAEELVRLAKEKASR